MKKITLILLSFLFISSLKSQCTAPSYNVNLSASSDTTWTLNSASRGGVCCGSSNCIRFNITLNPNTDLLNFKVASPAPSGSAFYQVNCGPAVSIGTPYCVSGISSPMTITYCKPGGDRPNFTIIAGSVGKASDDITIRNTGCTDTLFVTNIQPASIQWTSIYPGAPGAYNSYLSCTSGCNSTLVTAKASPAPPAYIDFQVSGAPNTLSCGTTCKDTVRVYFVNDMGVSITPASPVTCATSGTPVTITANPSGGLAPYKYSWSTGSTSSSITTSTVGTYTVTVSDKTQCPSLTLTKTLAVQPDASFTYTSMYCKNFPSNPLPTFQGTGQAGTFTATPAGLVFVNANTGEVNLAASAPNQYLVTNTVAATATCPGATDTTNLFILPVPFMTNASTATICTGGTVSIPLTANFSSSYSWIASDNPNVSGESLTAQTSTTLSNTLINNTAVNQIVTYTVTPKATIWGNCSGTPQTVTVTVRPKDNASFNYSSSTFCKTAANPSPTITGAAGGTFSGTAGLSINGGTGVINLAATAVGSYTVTYTVNNTCPNSATFPVTITPAPSPTFSYSSANFCQNAANPSPIFPAGSSAGTFSSTAGLVFVSNLSGQINLAASTPGTYTVVNTIAPSGGCAPAIASFTVTITKYNSATFSYTGTPYCQNSANPFPTFSAGSVAGTFSAPVGLSINSATGEVNLAASTPGTYTVTNSIAANGGCSATSATSSITITALPVTTFSYTGSPYCQNAGNPLPTFSGGGVAGTFSSSSLFLIVNSTSGQIDLANSTCDNYLVSNTIPAANGCPMVSTSVPVTISPLPIATFSYASNPYCENGASEAPVVTQGGTNGIFTGSSSSINVEPNSGTLDFTLSTAGTYTVTNTVPAFNGCPAVVATANVTITAPIPGNFNYPATPYCKNGSNPTPVFTGGGVAGTFTAPVGLSINSSTGLVNLAASTPGTYTVTNTTPPSNNCPSGVYTSTITITPLPVATFSYTASPYCQNGANPSPTFSGGGTAGTFTSTAGLSINSSTGVVNLAASTAGTYTVTNTIAAANGCPAVTATSNITITPLPVATFSYTGTPYCKNGSNPSPTFSGGGIAGTFTSTAGLSINSSTGLVNLAASTAGTYTVTNTIAAANGCPVVTATSNITITPLPVATFSYTASPYCKNGANPSPTYSGGGTAGTFTSTAGLSINSSTGVVNLAASTAGTYTVTNTIAAANGCPVVTATSNITITSLPVATFSYTGTPYCKNGSNPSPTFIGGGIAGTFTSTAGLSINSSTGVVNLAASTAGTYTVTNTIAAASGCPVVTATSNITITPLPVATFSYTASPYCQNGTNPSPTFSGGGTAGTFTSTAGLSINSSTGVVNLAASTAGTYTVTNTIAAANGCPVVTATSNITITPLPVATFSYTGTPYCQNGTDPSPTFSGGVAGTFSSTAGLIIDASTGVVNLAASTAGTYTVTNTIAAASGCPVVTATSNITITPLPVATFSYTASPYCQNGTDPSPTFSGGGTAGTFTSTAGLSINSSTGVVNLAASTAGTYTVTNTISAASGCPAVVETSDITITPLPVALFSYGPSPYCQNGTDPLPTFNGGGVAGIFSAPTDLNINSLTGAVNLAGSVQGTYTVTNTIGAADGCPSVIETSDITITTLPVATFSYAASPYCQNGTDPSPVFIGAGVAGTFTSSAGLNIDAVTGVINLSGSTIGTYTVSNTIDAANGCPAVTENYDITINPVATVNAGRDSSICEGSTFTLSGSIGGGATSLTWTTSGSGTFDDATSATAIYTPSASDIIARTITLTLTTNDPTGPCSSATDDMTLTIEPAAIADASSDGIICSGSSYTLAGNIAGGASSLVWVSSGNGTFDNNTSANATYTPSSADILSGNITLTLTTNDPAGFCAASSDDMILTINQMATAYAGVDTNICSGNTYKLSGSIGGGATSLMWKSNGTGTFDDPTSSVAVYTPSMADISTGNVILTISTDDPTGPCPSASDAMTLIINPVPTADAGTDMDICSGSQYTINGNIGGGASSSTWLSNGTGIFNDPSSLATNYQPSATDISNGSVLLVLATNDPNGACTSVNDTMLLTINPIATINAGADATICEGTEYNISGIVGGGANTLIWTSNGSGSFDNSNSANAIYTPSASDILAGIIKLTATSNDPAGACPAVSDEMILTITPRDNPSFSYSSASFCETGSDPSPVINGNTGGTFSVTPSSLTINSSTGTINLTGSSLGAYTVKYTTTGSCPDSSTVNLNITNGLVADFNYSSAAYCSNETDPLPILSSGSSTGIFSSTAGLVIDANSGQIDLSASTPGNYTVTNTVAASGGCAQATFSGTITINKQDNASFNYSALAFCHSSANQLPTITGTTGGVFSCNTSGLVVNASGEINVSASTPGTYPIAYTTNGVCNNSDTVNITINSLPIVNAGNERLIDCGANPIDLDVTDSLGNVVNFSWNTINGNILSGHGTNAVTINQTGLYYVIATNTFGCTACDTVTVNENPVVPEAAFTTTQTQLTGNTPFQLNFDNTSQNANTYSWNFGDGSAGTNMMNPEYTFNNPGTYTVTLVASNNGRCADTANAVVNVTGEFFIPEGFSPNGDGSNDVFEITGIERFKGNKLVIFNRWGNTVYEASPYTNQWDGKASSDMKIGDGELPVSTYYYVLDLGDGSAPIKGFIYLNK